MTTYVVHNPAGEIVRTISCPAEYIHLQVQEGETYIEADANPWDMIDTTTMEVIRLDEPMPPELVIEPYVLQRRAAYPSVESQLDMLWHAMDNGELPKVTGFYDYIKSVKDAIPKDNSAEATLIYGVGAIDEDLE
jgi:hypothetical protein